MRRWAGAALGIASLLGLAACGQAVAGPPGARIVGQGHSCADRTGDSTGQADLTYVLVQQESPHNRWRVSWTFVAPPKPNADAEYVLHARGPGGVPRSLAIGVQGNKVTKHDVHFPHHTVNLTTATGGADPSVQVTGSRVVAYFPDFALSGLSDGWAFNASILVDGGRVDACPDRRGGRPAMIRYKG